MTTHRVIVRILRAFALVFSCASLSCTFAAETVSKGQDAASKRVNAWFAEGSAAGLDGVYYDNRDRKHSDLGIANYPQLKPITYTKPERERRADWGAQTRILPGKIVIGNSSTASPANQAGSHQRMFYVSPRGLPFLYEQYRSNALYIYPEHRDHDPGTNGPDGYGDLYPANSPYLISSQGSSGSDRVFMHAFLKTIAAFPPKTRAKLVSEGVLMPTLQAIFRKAYKGSDDYFSGKSHPSAFDGRLIDEIAMVNLAHAMTPEKIPPLVKLRVLEETTPSAGRDFFEPPRLAALGERLGDSPCAIARVIRGSEFRRSLRVTAADSLGHPMKLHWKILRGDPQLITIETAGANDAEARITVAYHPRRPISPGSGLLSNRVDIGVFAEAEGKLVSAPAFVSFTTLPNEHRTYSDDGRLLEIFYGARSSALGMAPSNSDRWDGLLARFDAPDGKRPGEVGLLAAALGEEKLEQLVSVASESKTHRNELAARATKLSKVTAAQQKVVDETNQARVEAQKANAKGSTAATRAKLERAIAEHNRAKKAMRDGVGGAATLKKEIAALRAKIFASLRDAGASPMVHVALNTLRANPSFFSANEDAIRAVAKREDTQATLDAALRRLKFVGVEVSETPSPNERYHLNQLNLEILSGVLFPDFLKRPQGPLYSDPRLTTAKLWRDVFKYDASGKLVGWTRYQNGERFEFTAGGDLIRSGKPVPVRYQLDPQKKRLEFVAGE